MRDHIYIIDTNVLVAGLTTAAPDSPTAFVLDTMLSGGLFYLLSADLLQEYRSVLLRPELSKRHGLNEQEIDQFLTEIAANGIWREPPSENNSTAPDPHDAHLWALLASEPTAIIVSVHPEMVDVGSRQGSSEFATAGIVGPIPRIANERVRRRGPIDAISGYALVTGDRLLIENPRPQSSVISPAAWAEHFSL